MKDSRPHVHLTLGIQLSRHDWQKMTRKAPKAAIYIARFLMNQTIFNRDLTEILSCFNKLHPYLINNS